MKDIILIDIDHVVADSRWRDTMIGGEGGWDAYHRASSDDPPVVPMICLVDSLCESGLEILGLTSRPEKWRQLTVDWLVRHRCKFHDLLMRSDGDYRPSPQVKLDLARSLLPRVILLIDDRDDVCAVFRAEGIVVLQCHISLSHAPSIPFSLENAEGRLEEK